MVVKLKQVILHQNTTEHVCTILSRKYQACHFLLQLHSWLTGIPSLELNNYPISVTTIIYSFIYKYIVITLYFNIYMVHIIFCWTLLSCNNLNSSQRISLVNLNVPGLRNVEKVEGKLLFPFVRNILLKIGHMESSEETQGTFSLKQNNAL